MTFSSSTMRLSLIPLVALLTLVGCRSDTVCAGPSSAIRLYARDAQTGQAIGYPSVTAMVVGSEFPAEVIVGRPGDSTVVNISGHAGTYDVTVRKTGFADLTQRISVQGTDPCGIFTPVEVTVTLFRVP
jgi:hypothetical protein